MRDWAGYRGINPATTRRRTKGDKLFIIMSGLWPMIISGHHNDDGQTQKTIPLSKITDYDSFGLLKELWIINQSTTEMLT